MINLFHECEDSNVSSYADNTTLYSCATDILSVALEVQAFATKLFRWFRNNHLIEIYKYLHDLSPEYYVKFLRSTK